jgi:hypothetical protein
MKTMTDAQRMAIEDAQRMAIEARITQTARPEVSADAKYIVRAMVWIWVILPLIAGFIVVFFFVLAHMNPK